MTEIVRTQEEIDRVLSWTADASEFGSRYPGMSYEDGIEAMYNWLVGLTEDAPDGG